MRQTDEGNDHNTGEMHDENRYPVISNNVSTHAKKKRIAAIHEKRGRDVKRERSPSPEKKFEILEKSEDDWLYEGLGETLTDNEILKSHQKRKK